MLSIQIIWKNSGSGKWELEIEKNGIKVYSLKEPGTNIKKFKGQVTYEYTLNHIVAALIDEPDLDSCLEWIPTCTYFESIKKWNHTTQSDINLWRFDIFPPFSPRELVIQSHVEQDVNSKEVFVDVVSLQSKVPVNDCCLRMTHFHNTWRYTPRKDGKIDLEFVQNMDMAGFFPSFLINIGGAEETYSLLHTMLPGILDREKYRHTKLPYIDELELNMRQEKS